MKKILLIIVSIGFLMASFQFLNDRKTNKVSTIFTFPKSPNHPKDKVYLHIFNSYTDSISRVFEMKLVPENWRENNKPYYKAIINNENLIGNYYGFEIHNYDSTSQQFPQSTIIADPFSKAIVSQNHYSPINKSIIFDSNFNWGDDQSLKINPRELIIYEAHIKDMTAHPSSGVSNKIAGTYLGFIEEIQNGGIQHLKEMGYNAVEFLPIFEFANIELPFKDSTQFITNIWNPYEENHWGYMPSFFFAPEGSYASNNSKKRGDWNGIHGQQVNEFKAVIKKLHENGIAVILDVVYNHVSQYDFNPLKQIDKNQNFRKNEEGEYSSVSGCGNDLKTENSNIRNMIVQSVLFWINEYHIDGFRFDLGKLIDWKTIELIEIEAKKANPNIFLTCEPWGGGYDPKGFSDRNWSSWNDQFRNGLKGWHPDGNGGYIFGKWHPGFEYDKLNRVFAGSPREMDGQFINVAHSLNYLESHDDHTLGDFIRIETGKIDDNEIVSEIKEHHLLTKKEIKIHQLAATALLTSQGPLMIAQGQEWGRSKVIARTHYPDPNIGKIDHNSYEKDNETNWLNWEHKILNNELVEFYKDLITLRKSEKAFTHTDFDKIEFIKSKNNEFGIGYELNPENDESFLVLLNSSLKSANYNIQHEKWSLEISNNQNNSFNKNIFKLESQSIAIFRETKFE